MISFQEQWEKTQKWLLTTNFNLYSISNIRYLKLVVSIYPAIAAVLLAFYKEPIVDCTRKAKQYILHGEGRGIYTFNLWVFLYWFILLVWLFSYFFFVSNENSASRIATSNLRSAIFRAPNPNVFGEYELLFKKIRNLVLENESLHANETFKLELGLKSILENICELTSIYSNTTDTHIIYGANIMLYLPMNLHRDLIIKLRQNQLQWIHLRETDLDTFSGVLYLVPNLVFKTGGTIEPNNDMSSITLPVINLEDKEQAVLKNIPGAPIAAVDERFVFSDVRSSKAYRHLGLAEVNAAKEYWTKKLSSIRSVMSFSIPYKWNNVEIDEKLNLDIIGVLNIDSTNTNILGTDKEYYTTFISLL